MGWNDDGVYDFSDEIADARDDHSDGYDPSDDYPSAAELADDSTPAPVEVCTCTACERMRKTRGDS